MSRSITDSLCFTLNEKRLIKFNPQSKVIIASFSVKIPSDMIF